MKPITRRKALKWLTASSATLAATGLARSVSPTESERPNILFVLADDMMYRAFGAAGNSEVKTPHLDRLAQEGMHFTHCYVSNPICTPSRASVLTGQYGFQNGVTFFSQTIQPEAPRIGRILTEEGYRTFFTGKWHNDQRPLHHGFSDMHSAFLGGMHDYDSIPVVHDWKDEKQVIEQNPTEVFTDAALSFLNENPHHPFALFLWYTTPHDPREAPAEYETRYAPDRITLPDNFMPRPPYDTGTLEIRDEQLLPRPLDPRAVQEETARYYAMITHMDDQIGRLLQSLEEQGMDENTYIVFAADNGLTLGSHGLLGKQTMYEEGVHVPLLIRGPQVRIGQCHSLVNLMDLMPTFCHMANMDAPGAVQGRSLLPICKGRAQAVREEIFGHYDNLFRMIRTPRYKYVVHLKTEMKELFDLREDPYELQDLSASSRHRKVMSDLHRRLANWQEEVRDPDRIPNLEV